MAPASLAFAEPNIEGSIDGVVSLTDTTGTAASDNAAAGTATTYTSSTAATSPADRPAAGAEGTASANDAAPAIKAEDAAVAGAAAAAVGTRNLTGKVIPAADAPDPAPAQAATTYGWGWVLPFIALALLAWAVIATILARMAMMRARVLEESIETFQQAEHAAASARAVYPSAPIGQRGDNAAGEHAGSHAALPAAKHAGGFTASGMPIELVEGDEVDGVTAPAPVAAPAAAPAVAAAKPAGGAHGAHAAAVTGRIERVEVAEEPRRSGAHSGRHSAPAKHAAPAVEAAPEKQPVSAQATGELKLIDAQDTQIDLVLDTILADIEAANRRTTASAQALAEAHLTGKVVDLPVRAAHSAEAEPDLVLPELSSDPSLTGELAPWFGDDNRADELEDEVETLLAAVAGQAPGWYRAPSAPKSPVDVLIDELDGDARRMRTVQPFE